MKDKILTELCSIERFNGKMKNYLNESDFFTAPASASHHLAVLGGLAVHSWNVYRQLRAINDNRHLKLDEEAIIIAGLLHDVCKIDFYKPAIMRVRDDAGLWHDNPGYKIVDQEPLGHGEKSVIILLRFMPLTIDEQLAIRWHMGPWDAEGPKRKTLNQAMEKCLLLKALMLADQTATWLEEK